MKISRRIVGIILFGSIILLAGMLFSQFILKNIIEPTSLATWVLLRIFVLSIDQKYYWGAIILVVSIFLFRLLPQGQADIQQEYIPDSNATIKTIEYWRILFTLTADNIHDEETLKRELIHLLLSLYASKQHVSTNFILFEALKRGELPLPKHIHEFLFPDNLKKSKRSINDFIQSIRSAPRKWMRRRTGQETAERYRMIDETLSFIEKSMEMKNDDGKFTPNKY
jgi:hypothetical protein